MFCEWHQYRHNSGLQFIYCDFDGVETITQESVLFTMWRFLTKVKKIDGSPFPGKTLYDMVLCV